MCKSNVKRITSGLLGRYHPGFKLIFLSLLYTKFKTRINETLKLQFASHIDLGKESSLLGYDTVLTGKHLLTFRNGFAASIFTVKVKVKQSHYRPGQALRVPGSRRLRFPDF
jgi:hypothetical protein